MNVMLLLHNLGGKLMALWTFLNIASLLVKLDPYSHHKKKRKNIELINSKYA